MLETGGSFSIRLDVLPYGEISQSLELARLSSEYSYNFCTAETRTRFESDEKTVSLCRAEYRKHNDICQMWFQKQVSRVGQRQEITSHRISGM